MMLSLTGKGYCRHDSRQQYKAGTSRSAYRRMRLWLLPVMSAQCTVLHSHGPAASICYVPQVLDACQQRQRAHTHLHVTIHQTRCVHKVNCCKAALLACRDLCAGRTPATTEQVGLTKGRLCGCINPDRQELQSVRRKQQVTQETGAGFMIICCCFHDQGGGRVTVALLTCEQVGQDALKAVKALQVVKVADGCITSQCLPLPAAAPTPKKQLLSCCGCSGGTPRPYAMVDGHIVHPVQGQSAVPGDSMAACCLHCHCLPLPATHLPLVHRMKPRVSMATPVLTTRSPRYQLMKELLPAEWLPTIMTLRMQASSKASP